MVSDHATYLGVFKRIQAGDEDLIKRPLGKRWRDYMDNDDPRLFTEFVEGLMEIKRFLLIKKYIFLSGKKLLKMLIDLISQEFLLLLLVMSGLPHQQVTTFIELLFLKMTQKKLKR